ncbi:hypothetical protein [Herminiimonas contaminans]|uniref:Bacterial toxin YdaT domain-containing protein n=1 Tax=Herminiimonas contaminans TaxID=1111140 RepID=A0ABS0ES64_9BURK|nr:hypothetical protein [Herminiimonas contaminans]MBF8177681.1 hypothetical protein [Herminiimonas contaminans]
MRNESHKSLIGILREHVIAWRKAEGWSRETVVQHIVESDKGASGIVFNPQTSDTFERMKVNADRVFRWLDDESKDTNLCPPNFIPSILKAMPVERRLACCAEVMVSIGLGACLLSDGEEGDLSINDVFEVQRDDLDALQAVTAAIQSPTLENLEIADRKLARAQKRKERLQKIIAFARKAGGVLGRFIHPKKELV